VIGACLYVVGGGLHLSHLLAHATGPIDQSGFDASPAFTSVYDPDPLLFDRGASKLKVLIVSIVNGPTYNCLAAADLFSGDAIMVTSSDFVGMSGVLNCV